MKKNLNLKNILGICALFLLTILILFFSLKGDFKSIVLKLQEINVFWIIIALLFMFFYWFFKSFVLYNFTKKFNPNYKFFSGFRTQTITQFFNAVTPFSTGGQPFQIYSLKSQGLKISDATNVAIEEFVVYQISLVLLGIFAIALNRLLGIFPYNGILSRLVVIGFSINTFVIVFLFIVAFGKKINKFLIDLFIKLLSKLKIVKDKEKKLAEWNENINNFHRGAKLLIADKKGFVLNVFYSFLGLVCYYTIPIFIMFSIGDFSSFNGLEAIVASAYVMLIGSFVPLPGGAGGIEYGFINFFGFLILNVTNLKTIMLLWRFVTFYMGIIVGSIFLNIKDKR